MDGSNILTSPLKPNLWRAPNDNDRVWAKKNQIWKGLSENLKLQEFTVKELGTSIQVLTEMMIGDKAGKLSISYLINGQGQIKVDADFQFKNDLPSVPKVGMQVNISDKYSNTKYYGKGPHEAYVDRDQSARVGIYSSSIEDLSTPYIRPQENGNRIDVRWFDLMNSSNKGIRIRGNDLNIAARNCTTQDLEETTHRHLLPKRDFIELNIDHKIMGVGGDDTWTMRAKPHPEDLVPAANYHYCFIIEPKI